MSQNPDNPAESGGGVPQPDATPEPSAAQPDPAPSASGAEGAAPSENNAQGAASSMTGGQGATPMNTNGDGTVPPVPPAAAGDGAGGDGSGGGSGKKSRVGLFVGLGVGALILIAAIVAVVVLVLPMIFGGGGSSSATVRDYRQQPVEGWSFEFAGDLDEDYVDSIPGWATVGDDRALVWASFDEAAFNLDQGDSQGWYENYDEHYDLGYDAGAEYDDAWNQYIDGETDIFPRRADFFLIEWAEADENQGYYDGFWDGEDGEERGANRVEAPEDPDFDAVVTMLDLDTGEIVWELDLVGDADAAPGSVISATDIDGTPYVAIVALTRDDSALVTVNRDSGEIVSTFEEDGARAIAAIAGDLVVLRGENDELEGTVARYNPADLSEDPMWEVEVGEVFSVTPVGDDYIVARGWEDGEVLEAETGDRARWGRDIGESEVNYYAVAGHMVRIEQDDDEYEIEAISLEDGRSTWERAVVSEWVSTYGGALLIGDKTEDGFDRIQRIDIATGETMWENDIRDEFVGVGGLVQDRLLLANDRKRLVIFDAGSGEEIDENRVGELDGFFAGESIYYVATSDELIAFDISGVEELWAMRIDSDHQVVALGDRFVLLDGEELEIIGLE